MLQKTKGIVLRAVKYGETSLICSIFTEAFGVQSYLVQGVRTSAKKKQSRAGMLQPTTLLDMVVYNKPTGGLQRIKEFQTAHLYQTINEDVVKNSIALFSVEILLRLLPEHAAMEDLFDTAFNYFVSLDKEEHKKSGNYPLYLMIQCSNMLGYNINGAYSADTPYLSLLEGGYSHNPPSEPPYVNDTEANLLDKLLVCNTLNDTRNIQMNSDARAHLLDWMLAFMHSHTQHMGEIKSLPILREILH